MADSAIILHTEHIAMHNHLPQCEKTRFACPVQYGVRYVSGLRSMDAKSWA